MLSQEPEVLITVDPQLNIVHVGFMDVEDSVLSDVGTDTSTVRSGPGSFFLTRLQFMQVALLLWNG